MIGQIFLAGIEQFPIPTPKPGGVVAMDAISARKSVAIRSAMEAAGAELRRLSPYSPGPRSALRGSGQSNMCSRS
jgi:transposase